MVSRIISACPVGIEALPITVEVDVRPRLLKVNIVGLPDAATRESKERLIPAISNSGFALLNEEIVINLSPANLRKEGAGYDLPMAIGVLVAKGIIAEQAVDNVMFVGELALDGYLRPVRGVLAMACVARELGARALVVPAENAQEAAMVGGLTVWSVSSLAGLAHGLRNGEAPAATVRQAPARAVKAVSMADFCDVKGQLTAKRALEIAAAGGHNMLMIGPPGSGKSMLSKRVPSILPAMSDEECLEVTKIYSAAGLIRDGRPLALRPFRSPHHTASMAALVGGGSVPRPGEVTLAHRGVLFLDELPEFSRNTLEVLRQPLEDRCVTISRVRQQMTFPADFVLIAAMNPCPCGFLGDQRRDCSCSPERVEQYRARLSGPLLDRIDIHLEVSALSLRSLRRLPPSESSARIRARVTAARARMFDRFGDVLITNANMDKPQLEQACRLPNELADYLEEAGERAGISARVYDKLLRVARTIADLAGREHLVKQDLQEALGYRALDRKPLFRHRQTRREVH